MTRIISLELSQIDLSELRQVAERYELDLIVLFGSYAKGRARRGSDMDIAVHTTQKSPLYPPFEKGGRGDFGQGNPSSEAFWEMDLIADLSRIIPTPEGIDLVILNQVDSATLLYEVSAYGIPIYQRESMAFHQFRSYAARRFYDDAKFRRWGWEYLKRRCKIGERSV